MPATPIVASDRFFHRGTTKIYAVTAIANTAAPTRAELNAGTDLSPQVQAVEGWEVAGAEIETPDLGSVFTSKLPGATSVDESSITMYADQQGTDVRTLLPRGASTHIVMMFGGDVAGNKCDVYKVRVRSNAKPVNVEDEAGLITVAFSITAEPNENVTVPA